MDSVNDRWEASDKGKTALKIWPRLDKRRTMSLLKLQRSTLSVFVGVITGHCIMGLHARRIGLGHLVNDFCRSCRDKEEKESVIHLLDTEEWRMKNMGTWNNCQGLTLAV